MTKKGTLIGSIVCLLFIAIMIPIAIFASTKEAIQNTNCVKFTVVDFQGNFYLALIGNKPDTQGDSTDIGTCTTTSLTPAPLFTAKYDETEQKYNVYNVYNSANEKTEGTVEFPKEIDIEFDATHSRISYYFVFINTATNASYTDPSSQETEIIDNRDVLIRTNTNPSSIENISSKWSYGFGTANEDTISTFTLPTQWIEATGDLDNVTVEARDDATVDYNYVVLKFSMEVDPTIQVNINSQFTIVINLSSASEEK